MNKEQQIEEMAFIALKNTLSYTCAKQIAINFYNAGYRKVPDYAVILTPKDTVKEMNAMCNIDEQRKQAVKEFASKLKDKVVDFLYSATVDGHPGFDIHISGLWHMIDELLKEYE